MRITDIRFSHLCLKVTCESPNISKYIKTMSVIRLKLCSKTLPISQKIKIFFDKNPTHVA